MKTVTACRACGSVSLDSVLDLGSQPLANQFLTEGQLYWPDGTERSWLKYPLHLVRCLTCGLAQLDHVVDPWTLYGPHYAYRSGYSSGWRDHCFALAAEIGPDKHVLDIGALDGILIEELLDRGCFAMGCDPSGTDPLIRKELFGKDTRFSEPKFDVIVAQNVFGHVGDAKGFLQGVAENLAPDGQAIIEVPWVVPMVCEGRWDTIYHEHLSYWGLEPLRRACTGTGLDVVDVRHFPDLHGGTVRFYLKRANFIEYPIMAWDTTEAVREMVLQERRLTEQVWKAFAAKAGLQIRMWEQYFLNQQGKSMAGYGASAKGNTFLNALWVRPSLVGIFDDTPQKQGLYTPGWHFPVLTPTREAMEACDELVCLAPNWAPILAEKAKALGFTGTIVSLWHPSFLSQNPE